MTTVVMVKSGFATFDLSLGSLRALPLKIPQGALPLDPTNFLKKVRQKLLSVIADSLIIIPNEVSQKSFLSTFFQKSGRDFQGRQPLKQDF